MQSFIMRALSRDNKWYEFKIEDAPTLIDDDWFILANKEFSYTCNLNTIRRGVEEYDVFEGDIILDSEGDKWLVCYERGFYCINENYNIKYLYQFNNIKVVGDIDRGEYFPISINFRVKHLFKYGKIIFRINDICGAYKKDMLIRSVGKPVKPSDVKQECCCVHNGTRIYLGDKCEHGVINLYGGRIAVPTDNGYLDITTGGLMNGYFSTVNE